MLQDRVVCVIKMYLLCRYLFIYLSVTENGVYQLVWYRCALVRPVKALVSPSGEILWLSPSYPGSFNDNIIIRDTKDQWFSMFDKSEWGLGDSGFSGMDEEFRIITPPPVRNSLYSLISSKTIKVEMVFENVKNWRCCREQLRYSTTGNHEYDILSIHHKLVDNCRLVR